MKTIQVQLALTLDETAATTLADLLALAINQGIGIASGEADGRREARTRASQHAIFGGQKPPEDRGLLIDSREVARLLNVSSRHVYRLNDSGRMPPPIRIGNAVRWSLEMIQTWVMAGCPVDPAWRSRRA